MSQHLSSAQRAAYLGSLSAGSDLDLRGTEIDAALLAALRGACVDPTSGETRFGRSDFAGATFTNSAQFESAVFTGEARFDSAFFTGMAMFNSVSFTSEAHFESATFSDTAWFESAVFTGEARFRSATFTGEARFRSASFEGEASFESAAFSDTAHFESAVFTGETGFRSAAFARSARFVSAVFADDAWFRAAAFADDAHFDSVTFGGTAYFSSAIFAGGAHFGSAAFIRNALFQSATFNSVADFAATAFAGSAGFGSTTFDGLQHIGPMTCARLIEFDDARFTGTQTTIEVSAASMTCQRTAFEGSVVLRLRYAMLSLDRATLAAPVALQTWPMAFAGKDGTALNESLIANSGTSPAVRLASLDGVDAAHLVLTDVDLSNCRLTGAFNLDQIRIGFGCQFAEPPAGWHLRGIRPARWSRRKVLAEEQHWRAQVGGPGADRWPAGPHHQTPERVPGPDDLAGVYQQLRKAFEEAGNEPDAADFYYGEMEMRRHDRRRPRAERQLLGAYWLASGYGLRASRALAWLLTAMVATLLLLMAFGLPNNTPDPQTTGSYGGGSLQTTTKTPDPTLTLPWNQRLAGARAEKAALVVVNSVVFRSSGQNLTLPGTITEMASRIGEPVLLGLAALAIRSRVKR
ncbi:pentapeptide repeat-containing protein [Kitasatospora sp. NPDC058201]|uniref:pentapeptide repeat-containing protein n=1 Tax=unclassified Kitasatospora TaxID=2633591 RepID=UPI00366621DD